MRFKWGINEVEVRLTHPTSLVQIPFYKGFPANRVRLTPKLLHLILTLVFINTNTREGFAYSAKVWTESGLPHCIPCRSLNRIRFASLHTLQRSELNLGQGFATPATVCLESGESFAAPAIMQTESQAYFCNPCIVMNRILGMFFWLLDDLLKISSIKTEFEMATNIWTWVFRVQIWNGGKRKVPTLRLGLKLFRMGLNQRTPD